MEIPKGWRESLQKSLAPILLTILGTIAYQSALYVYRSPDAQRAIMARLDEQVYRVDSNHRDLDASSKMTEGWVDKEKQRRAQLWDVRKAVLPGAARRDLEIYSKAVDALSEINRELGELQGFLEYGNTTSAHALRTAQLSSLQAELRAWEVVRKYSYPLRDRKSDKNFLGDLIAASLEMERADSYIAGALRADKVDIANERQRSDQALADLRGRIKAFRIRHRIAEVVASISVGAWVYLLLFMLTPDRKELVHHRCQRFE